MKRFFSIFGVIVIFTMHCLSFYPAKAAITSVDYGEMLNTYLGAAETALAASQGATIDWSNIDLPAGSDTWTDNQKAQYVVQYIGALKKVGQHAIYDWLFGEENDTQDVISSQTAAIGLAKNSNIDTLDIKAQLDNILATQSNEHVFQKYSDKVIARWNEYNTNYINNYLDQMNYVEAEVPNPDINYINYINEINDVNDSWLYASNPNPTYPNYYLVSPMEALSICSISPSDNLNSRISYTSYNILTYITDIRIYSLNDNLYHFDCQPIKVEVLHENSGNYNVGRFASNYPNGGIFTNDSRYLDPPLFSKSGSLEDIFKYIRANFSHVNIYVDNKPWALPNSTFEPQVTFNIPDAVIDNSSDDGKIVAHPIYYPDIMNIDKAIDIDLDKVVDAIASRIAAGNTDITFDDLVDAGAAVKLDGTTLTDADTVVKDVSVPIARARVDTIDGVIPTIDVVPPLPPLPPLNPGDYSGEGFNGMTVLARIINVTVQGLPEPLILTFFGVVFGAVILGIIKILHH